MGVDVAAVAIFAGHDVFVSAARGVCHVEVLVLVFLVPLLYRFHVDA